MHYFAVAQAADPDLWAAVGLLHDMDYEQHPNQEQDPTEGHPFVGVEWLRQDGWNEEVCRAILSMRTTPAFRARRRSNTRSMPLMS